MLAWAVLGVFLGVLPLAPAALVAAALYAAAYGLAETTGRLRPRAPGTRAGAQAMVMGASRRRRLLVWGSNSGPGS